MSNCLQRQPIARLAQLSRVINVGNAVFLVTAGGIGIGSATQQPGFEGVIGAVLLSVYVLGFGWMLLRYELRLGAETLLRDYGFMYTFGGRCAFLALVANLCWTVYLPAAIATNVNALLNALLMISHPAFTSGQVKWSAIEDPATGVEIFTPVARDPAAVAQSARAEAAVTPRQQFGRHSYGVADERAFYDEML